MPSVKQKVPFRVVHWPEPGQQQRKIGGSPVAPGHQIRTCPNCGTPEVDPFTLAELTADYLCPVCGIGLAQSDFDTPERDYYCPSCSTRQTPSVR